MIDDRAMMPLFAVGADDSTWIELAADGYDAPVPALIHRARSPAVCGMPLGGIDTGCIDLETDGTLGYMTVFNSHVPRRGPLNLPFLGISVGSESWIFSTRKLTKDPLGTTTPGMAPLGTSRPLRLARGAPARDIHYWGHCPVADMEMEWDCPVGAGVRAWSPFVPGDIEASMVPGAVFEVRLRNGSAAPAKGRLVMSFPGPSPQETGAPQLFTHEVVRASPGRPGAGFAGVLVSHAGGTGYALGAIDESAVETGGDLGTDSGAWARIADGPWFNPAPSLPAEAGQAGASIAVSFALEPGQGRTIRFVLAWHSPAWKGSGAPMGGGNTYTHMYASRFAGALAAARYLAATHRELLRRIIAWQHVVYAETSLPPWARESLVNILHIVTEDGLWAQAKPPIGDWCAPADGVFGMSESPRGCAQMECIPCSFLGGIPLTYFFPRLALSTLRALKALQFPDGQVAFSLGSTTGREKSPPCELSIPSRGYEKKPQTLLDGSCYAGMVDRLWRCTGDEAILRELYDSVKRNTLYTMGLRPGSGPAGIVSMAEGNDSSDWVESVDLFGIVPHVGGIHLAHLAIAERMAEAMSDSAFASLCRTWRDQGRAVMDEHAWAGDNYLLYHEPETGKRSGVLASFQLDGDWIAAAHGVSPAFDIGRSRTALATLKETVGKRGALLFTRIDDFDPGYWSAQGIFVPLSLTLAMTYMYVGDRAWGMEVARRTMRSVLVENRCSWDSPIVIRGDNGERIYGNDYHLNLVLWALPAAAAGTDLAGACRPDGLVARIIRAGAAGAAGAARAAAGRTRSAEL